MRNRMPTRPYVAPHAHAPTRPIPRAAVPTERPRPTAEVSSQGRSRVRHPGGMLLIIGLAQPMAVLDTTIGNIARPSAQGARGFGPASRQWIIAAYSLAFGSLL